MAPFTLRQFVVRTGCLCKDFFAEFLRNDDAWNRDLPVRFEILFVRFLPFVAVGGGCRPALGTLAVSLAPQSFPTHSPKDAPGRRRERSVWVVRFDCVDPWHGALSPLSAFWS